MPRSLPRKGIFDRADQLIRGIPNHVGINAQGHGYVAMPGQILYFFDVASGGAQPGDIGVPQNMGRDMKG